MAEVLLFHSVHGQTAGFHAFADELRRAGHRVHTPDLYEGTTFESLDDGVNYARTTGFDTIVDRGVRAADDLPPSLVYGGFSLGVMPAQKLAQTPPGRRGGAVHQLAALPASEFGGSWPDGVPLQIHMMEDDEWALEDLPAARELVDLAPQAELFPLPRERHIFADNSLSDYDVEAASLLTERVVAFLRSTSAA